MYIKPTETYYDGSGQQFATRQWFLILVQTDNIKCEYGTLRAIVRKVALAQFGHWMMGYARAFGESITISGSYGSDGLPTNVPQHVYDNAVVVPDELYEQWSNGGGWNSAGSEASAMRQWAIDNFELLAPKNAVL